MSKSDKDTSINFEKAIHQMQNDLQYLTDKGSVSKRFIKKQNQILKSLICYYNHTQKELETSKSELIKTRIANSTYRERLENRIVQFEAICIMYGILDFPRFLALPKNTLIDWAEQLYKDNHFLYADSFKDLIKELPVEQKEVLENILFEKSRKEISELLKKTKNSNVLKNGTRI
ncbi:hypothetical protein [Aquimarina longa]|uniref:hypothetical protein n=1 Tax=Aquimarina longa TaxID=1080221 RepID=UPI0007823C7C|nr:hypothetical protein [Aquimarina longa]